MLSRRPHPPVRPIDATDSELRDIGQLLRETRQGRGEDVYDIAEYLRIRPAYLFALEQGDLSIMPGRPYAMGFLRTYGDYLEVDGAELVQRVRRAKDAVIAGPELVYRTPAPDNRRPTKALIAASIVGAAFIYGSWYLSYSGFTSLLDRITGLPLAVGEVAVSLFAEDEPEAPPAVQATVQAGAPGAPRPSNAGTGRPTNRDGGGVTAVAAPPASLDELRLTAPEASVRPAVDQALAAAPAGGSDGTSALAAEPAPVAEVVAASPAAAQAAPSVGSAGELLASLEASAGDAGRPGPDGARTFGAAEGAGRVVLVARDSSWIQIRSESRDYVRTRTLEPGDRFVLPNRSDLALWTGNAGGLEVVIDGRSLGPLGAAGAVIRQIALTPQELRARTGRPLD